MTEKQAATNVVRRLQDAGFEAVFVGGYVRDVCMQKASHDIDIATAATPEEVEALFVNTIPVGESFGVVLVDHYGYSFEVATFREDSEESDGRRPDSVTFTSDKYLDASRRDFTINAMMYDPISREFFDYFGGLEDIAEKRIRFVGIPDKRIDEDKLRMLRAVRFATTLDFILDHDVVKAIQSNCTKILVVSAERVKIEIDKVLQSLIPSKGFENLVRTGLINLVLPEVVAMQSVLQSTKWHSEGNAYTHSMIALDIAREATDDLDVLWATLLHDTGKVDTYVPGTFTSKGHANYSAIHAEEILMRFKASTKHKNTVVSIVADHMRIKDADRMRKAKVRRLMAEDYFEKLLTVAISDSAGSIPIDDDAVADKHDWLDTIESLRGEVSNKTALPKCVVSGRDLIELGLTPGPKFSEILNTIMDYQLEGVITSKEEALNMIKGEQAVE